MSKLYYITRKNNEGNIGIHSNIKSAFKQAEEYTRENGGTETTIEECRKSIKEGEIVFLIQSNNGFGNVFIECFYLDEM